VDLGETERGGNVVSKFVRLLKRVPKKARLKWAIFKETVKRKVVRILKKWLGALDELELLKCSIAKDCTFTLSKFIPNDGKWHHMAISVDYWIKLDDNIELCKDEKYIDAGYLDGILIDEFRVKTKEEIQRMDSLAKHEGHKISGGYLLDGKVLGRCTDCNVPVIIGEYSEPSESERV